MPTSSTGIRLGIDGREFLHNRQTGIGRFILNFLQHTPSRYPEHRFFVYGNQDTEFKPRSENTHFREAHEGSTVWWDQHKLPRMLAEDAIDLFLSPYDKGPVSSPCPEWTDPSCGRS